MKRFLRSGLTAVLAIGIMVGAFVFTAHQSSAARLAPATQEAPDVDLSARGPSVGVDVNNNQFVFWKGSTNSNLFEAVWTADPGSPTTGSWSSGALNLENVGNNLASQPSVAVENVGGFVSGSHRYGAQFVVWRGSTNDLWYAFWDGSWNGAVEVPSAFNVADTPSVAFNNVMNDPGESEITIFWEGTDGNLYYIRRTDPLAGAGGITGTPQWVGPHEATFNGQSVGPLGSAPGASNSTPVSLTEMGCVPGVGAVTWNGATNSELWYVPYQIDCNSGDVEITSGPAAAPYTGVNGAPSATEEYSAANRFDFAWEDNNNDLVFGYSTNLITFQIPQALDGAGSLASAPSIGFFGATASRRVYIFFKGPDGYLHEALFNLLDNNGNGAWHFYTYSQFGVIG